MNIQQPNVCTNSNKWELAQLLLKNSKAPKQALESIFAGAILQIEAFAKTSFAPEMKERVWTVFSKDKLNILQDTLKTEFCHKILGSFNETETLEMVEEHKQHGAVMNQAYCWRLQIANALHHEEVSRSVINKAGSMTDAWIQELIEAVKKEGVALPEVKKSTS